MFWKKIFYTKYVIHHGVWTRRVLHRLEQVGLAHLDQAHDVPLPQSNQVAVSRPIWIKEFY